jgi:ATP-dependent RNA helicase RhlE
MQGRAILLYTPKEMELKDSIETLMKYSIPVLEIPAEVEMSTQLTPDEKTAPVVQIELSEKNSKVAKGASFHKKSAKNSKEKVEKKSYQKTLKEKYKKPIRLGDKIQNMKAKRKKK